MFARVKKSGTHQYLQLVENRRENGKVAQRVIATLGRMDQLAEKGSIESIVRSLSRFSDSALLVLSAKSQLNASAKKIGPTLIFERLWKEMGIGSIVSSLVSSRKFGFNVERALFLTVLHRLFVSGSDRGCEKWRRDYLISGVDELELHHLYRAMGFLGEELFDQKDRTPFAPRCTKDLVEERMFDYCRTLFTDLDLVLAIRETPPITIKVTASINSKMFEMVTFEQNCNSAPAIIGKYFLSQIYQHDTCLLTIADKLDPRRNQCVFNPT